MYLEFLWKILVSGQNKDYLLGLDGKVSTYVYVH